MHLSTSPKKPLLDEEGGLTDDNTTNNNDTDQKNATDPELIFKLPFSRQFYYMTRPTENVHNYIWVLKDLSWSQDWYYPALIFGIIALIWCLGLFYEAYHERSWYEAYMAVGVSLWLVANFVWMSGEVFHSDDDGVQPPSSIILETAMSWILFYFLVLKPFGLLAPPSDETERFRAAGLKSRISYFQNWREYEHFLTLLWILKDLSWNQNNLISWVIFMIPTFLVAFDFIWVTWCCDHMFIDCVHYVSQLLWITGNAVWAMSNVTPIQSADDDDPYSVWKPSKHSAYQLRWWSSVILVLALVPLILLYFVWLPLTFTEHLKAADIPENDHIDADTTLSCCGGGGGEREERGKTMDTSGTSKGSGNSAL